MFVKSWLVYQLLFHPTLTLPLSGEGTGFDCFLCDRWAKSNSQPSTVNSQPSTVNRQPSTVNSQPSTVNRQPSTVVGVFPKRMFVKSWLVYRILFDPILTLPLSGEGTGFDCFLCDRWAKSNRHPWSVSEVEPSTVNRQPSTVNSQQSTVNSQQSTVNSQPSTVNSQQSTVNSQPSTVNRQQSPVSNYLKFVKAKPMYLYYTIKPWYFYCKVLWKLRIYGIDNYLVIY
jgi:hypothetical protein